MDAKGGITMCALKWQVDRGGHYDVEMQGWLHQGAIWCANEEGGWIREGIMMCK